MRSQVDILYKYRGDNEFTEKLITTNEVWLSDPASLNDPLECRTGKLDQKWKKSSIKSIQDAHMSGFILSACQAVEKREAFFSFSFRKLRRFLREIKKLNTREEKYRKIRSFYDYHKCPLSNPASTFDVYETTLAKVGIFSLSECPRNDLMWAHYADNHKGVAIGFKCSSCSKLADPLKTLKVIYSDQKPKFSDSFRNSLAFSVTPEGGLQGSPILQFDDPMFINAVSTKPKSWGYEKEWRYIEPHSGLHEAPGPISEIVFGYKMPQERREHYVDLVSASIDSDVVYREIVLDEETMGFEVEDCVALGKPK